ncbi:MAG: ProQ/FINO family protein, partial [Rubrivivax sp.]
MSHPPSPEIDPGTPAHDPAGDPAALPAATGAGETGTPEASPAQDVAAKADTTEPGAGDPVSAAPPPGPGEPVAPAAPAGAPEMTPAACAARLAELFPALFGTAGPPRPVKLRVHADVQQRAPGVFTRRVLSAFLSRHTTTSAYLRGLVESAHRFDLDGQPAGEI